MASVATSGKKTMQRITALNRAEATGKAKQLLDGVQARLGLTASLMRTLDAGLRRRPASINYVKIIEAERRML